MRKIKDNSGNSAVFSAVICLVIVLIASAVFEYMQLMIITAGIRNAVESACVSVVTTNYDETYSQLREGYSGAYLYKDSGFEEIFDTGNVYSELDGLLGLFVEGGKHIKNTSAGVKEYAISDMRIEMENTELAQDNSDKNLNAIVSLKVEIPVRYGGRELLPLELNMKVKASYTPKF